jgi:chromosome segregation protein
MINRMINKRKKVKLTKMSIDELGPVNLNAIEQFEELNERYTFLF